MPAALKIHIPASQRHSCICCGLCCRRFRVLLRAGETERLGQLDWGTDNPHPGRFWETFGGHAYFKRRADGACVFLGEDERCLMHARFGFDIKALTCRGYPYNFASTWPGEATVLARLDCPAALRNQGELISKNRRHLEQLASELRFGGGFSAAQLQGLQRPAIELLCQTLRRELQTAAQCPPDQLANHLMLLVHKWETLGANFLNDLPTLKKVMPSLLEKCREESRLQLQEAAPLSAFSRSFFRQMLSAYVLRDEELLDTGLKTRLAKTWQLGRLVFGYGNIAAFGQEHPDYELKPDSIFAPDNQEHSEARLWEVWRRFIELRLETLQFFAFAYYGTSFFAGLKALLLSYPLSLALARIQATSQNRRKLAEDDLLYAVAAIDHCHGRSPRLKFRSSRQSEQYFSAQRFPVLIKQLGHS